MKKKKQTVREDSEDDSDDDYGIAEANCELAMVESHLCNLPYELYDLQDLTEILSTETWDSILTEEERFLLSRFLPDMDQESFGLTMQELLGGVNLYFGSPVDKFFKKLRGGLFTPKVACCKEGVTFFKRKRYYYSLKFYHERMIKTFIEMQRLWDQYGRKDLSKNARLLLWSERRQSRNLKMLDLNRVPSNEMDCATTAMERNRTKNTLKLKITNKGIFRYQEKHHHHQSLPKGLLKVIPKPSSSILKERYLAPEIHETGSKSRRFAVSPPYGTIACSTTTELPNCLLNHQDTSFTYLEATTRRSINRTETLLHDPTHTIHRGLGASNLLTKKDDDYDYAHYHLKPPGFSPGILDTSSETMETKRVLSGKNFQREANVLRKPLRVLKQDNHDHARETDDDHLFSLTYKRRKVQRIGVA